MLDPSDTVPVDDAVATDVQCVLPHHVGGCSCREPTLEIDNWLQEVGGNPAPATKTHTHTASTHKTYFKEKDPGHEEGSIQKTHIGTRLIKAANRALHLN